MTTEIWPAEGFGDETTDLQAQAPNLDRPDLGRPDPGHIVLNVGCGYRGPDKLPRRFRGAGWREVRLDLDARVAPDIVASVTDLSAFADASVDAIWSSHCLEHVYRHEVPLAIGEFFRVLRPGGLLLVAVPDLQRVAALVADGLLDEAVYEAPSGPITAFDMIYGHAGLVAAGHLNMAHKSGFTSASLGRMLTGAGFAEVAVWPGATFDLWASARRPSTPAGN